LWAWISFLWYSTNHRITAIHDAARKGDLAEVKDLLMDNPELIAGKDDHSYHDNGMTPLYVAAQLGRKDMAELLRQHGGHD
jgi:hypothetical protein